MDNENESLAIGGTAIAEASTDPLRKPHEMIVMVPRSKRVTLTGRRIYNALLQISQLRMSAMESMPAADYMFEAPLPAVLRTTGSKGEDRTAAKRYLKEMRGLEVDWESTAPGDGVKWRGFSMLSEVAIEIRGGENWVSWSYPPTVMAAIKEPSRWARIDLDILASLSTYAGVALYEICARYRDNPSGVTSRKPVAWWADALSQSAAGTERREWRKIKNERVKPAIDEINEHTDLEIELIEHKDGRSVVDAQFAVRKKRISAKASQTPDVVDANLVLRAEALGIRELKLEGLIREFGEALVRDKVETLEKRAANSTLRGVENSYSYLRSLLRNDDETIVDEASSVSSTSAAQPATKTQDALGLGSATKEEEEWLNRRIAELKVQFQTLTTDQRQGYVDAALDELVKRGQLTASVSRRAAQGDVLHGLLGSVVVRIYASSLYGSEWNKPGNTNAA